MPRTKAKRAPKTEKKEKTADKPKSTRKSNRHSKKEKEPEPVPEVKTVEEVTESVPESTEEKTRKKRHVPTRESLEKEFDDLISSIEEEIVRLRESTAKSKGVKFLRSVGKKIKTLRAHTLRVTKQRKTTTRRNNSNSGFLKPVKISKELAKFTGWDHNELKSRVDVTKYICNYIKEQDLQNPEDRRQIRVSDDSKLRKLLKFDTKKDKKPLTYYSLQTYLKPHFVKDEPNKSK